ncbi:type I polyketide synthase [Spiractinospora alimapuensis]|uniref:type I polyketide synthase n=1 Tax=Spiractinospora alimapuensis TaxID=2820884 RepID=UPI001F29DAD6|nr:type I polyketide synthase [Spiractinospora alimapuensis]
MSGEPARNPRGERSACEEPVAVVGISCRFSGVQGPDEFWRAVLGGESRIRELPPPREFDNPPEEYTRLPAGMRRGGFLTEVAAFDAGFFGISPREAAAMDPQQRLMLELGWQAFEDAGIVPRLGSGNTAGVFVGSISDDYSMLSLQRGPSGITAHTLAGLSRGVIANRISYAFGLSGPSLTVDAAQASALTAVHLARSSVARGESEIALAGGVNLVLSPLSTLAAARFGALSPDGLCYTFDARANGYVRGEGGGFVLLKQLDTALADGDRIYCVLRGSATNNDGHTAALTIPNVQAQEAVLTKACANSGVDPAEVDYVELHGTGTPTGDPVEARALGTVFGQHRLTPLRVGSVKTNIGHLEGASGIAGLIKVALSIHHRKFAPSLNITSPNPALRLERRRLEVQVAEAPWEDAGGRHLAGVSSFGMGGSNCHVVLGAASASNAAGRTGGEDGRDVAVPLVVSARTPAALRAQAGALADRLEGSDALADVAYSLATTRTPFEHRIALTTSDLSEAVSVLSAHVAGESPPRAHRGRVVDGERAYLFSGQGAQRPGMGAELAGSVPEFAHHFDEVLSALEDAGATRVREALTAEPGTAAAERLDRTGTTQPALFAIEVALFRLLGSWGVTPDYVVGHSVGEVAAAHVAGVLSLPDACTLITARGALMQRLPDGGGMLSVRLSEKEVISTIAGFADRVSVAAVNSPTSTVISGDADALTELAEVFRDQGTRTTALRVSHAFHSARMDPILDPFRETLRGLRFRTPQIPLVSNLTGEIVSEEILDPDYWVRHARQTVRFADSVTQLSERGVSTFIELGPGRNLTTMAEQCLDRGSGAAVVPLLPHPTGERPQVMDAVARLHVRGVEIDWGAVFGPRRPARVALPTYAFQRTRYWVDGDSDTDGDTVAVSDPSPTGSATPETIDDERRLIAELASLDATQRLERLSTFVCREVAEVLGYGGADAVDPHQTFHDLGCDSVMSVELRDRLSAESGVGLPATLVFDHPTPAAVTQFLLDELGVATTGTEESPTGGNRTLEIDSMATDDLVRLAFDTSTTPDRTDLGG